ncbi:potassium transporter TrkG [Lysinibacter sp. HNR]|uniref:TrkH family potassium uptake protein n=1 Tax=Lysinibacter sp. HNR TaxID=3031408 RepID=UPI002435EA31|nr:potassium transporter TrkG [Lysinibacter sp. HNR]WGD37628.1 potassium transporter TrkG [Lysinibacter sp. HNR]
MTRPIAATQLPLLKRIRKAMNHFVESWPARFAITVFSALILLFTGLLMLPISAADGSPTPLVNAFFTAMSAICVTGLTVVDMATHWSTFGNIVVLLGLQIGGIGVLTVASLLGVAVSRRLGLKQRLLAASDNNPARAHHGPVAESQTVRLGDIGGLLGAIVSSVLVIEGTLTLLILPRLLLTGETFLTSLWQSFYFAASAFTNTGFVPTAAGMEPFKTDPYMLIVLGVGVSLGSIGFPVIFALYRFARARGWRRPHRLPLHAKLTLLTTGALIALGALAIAGLEWDNDATLGEQTFGQRILSSLFMSTMTRSGGLSTLDVGEMNGSTLLSMDMLMFVGGGSASTAGGIKVTTLAVLFLAAFAEARGYKDIQAFERRIPTEVLRVAVSVVLWAATIIATSTIILLQMTKLPLDYVLFDVISAFGTCGLSTGVTENLPDAGKYVLAATMWAGRVGTVTLAAAVAASTRSQFFRRPEERPIVG